MRRNLAYGAVIIGLALSATPAAHATKTVHHLIVSYKVANPGILVWSEGDLGSINVGEENLSGEVGGVAEIASDVSGEAVPNPLSGTPADTEPLGGTAADAEHLRGTPADTYYGGGSFDLPAGAEQVKIKIVDDAATAAGASIAWQACGIHGNFCAGDDVVVDGCSASGETKPLYAFNNVRQVSVWVFANDDGALTTTNGCETSLAMAGTIRLDWLS